MDFVPHSPRIQTYVERARAKKDASDIAFILRNYIGEWNRTDLYEHNEEAVEAENYDEIMAGARMLGREMVKILSLPNRQLVLDILQTQTGEQEHYRLIEDMMNTPEQFNNNLALLEALNRGLHDESQ